jgi:hypothetical protein
MTAHATRTAPLSGPTETDAEFGEVVMFGVTLTEAERWVEDGEHVVRSTEFGVVAGAPTLPDAVDRLCETLKDLADHITAEPMAELTPEELERATTLYHRLADAYETGRNTFERMLNNKRRAAAILVGRRRRLARGVEFRSAPTRSSQRSTA